MNHSGHTGHAPAVSMPVLVFKKEQFTDEELDTLNKVVSAQGRQYIHLPGVMEIGEYKTLGQEGNSFDELLDKIPFNAGPVVDDSPFFYNYDRFVPKLLLAIIAAAVMAIMVFSRFNGYRVRDSRIVYFSALGIAYIMVEIPVIQKMSLFFGSPSLAFSVAVPVLLASSGIGSLISRSKQLSKYNRYVPEMAAAIGAFLVVAGLNYIAVLPGLKRVLDKVMLAVLVLFPAGFFMGMPFPSGIARIKSGREDKAIPFMWGINGLASVLGSTLATVFSMKFGFSVAILAGAAVYILLFFSRLQGKLVR
ncbi:MAG: hypothetical protein QME73_08445 [Bacillota bacterium]|nr:hypothetical protein [Bacillota bacterium]